MSILRVRFREKTKSCILVVVYGGLLAMCSSP